MQRNFWLALILLAGRLSAQTGGLPGIDITMTASPDPVVAGNNITYTITVTNVSSAAVSKVSVADSYPPGFYPLSFTAPPGWTTWVSQITDVYAIGATSEALSAGESASFTVVLPIPASTPAGRITNYASVETPAGIKQTSTTTKVLASPLADLVVTNVASPAPVAAGNHNITYTISITNDGASPATQATLLDAMPAGTSFVSFTAPPGWTTSTPSPGTNGTITAGIPSFPPGGSGTFVLVVNDGVIGVTAVVKNTATVTTTSAETTSQNNSATATSDIVDARVAAVSLEMKADRSAVAPGDSITYTLAVTNAGPGTAVSVKILDTLPSGVSFVSATPSQGSCSGTQTVVCTLGSINVNASATVALVVKGTSVSWIWNSATVSGDDRWTQPVTASAVVQVSTAIPALSPLLLALLAALLAAVAVRLLTE